LSLDNMIYIKNYVRPKLEILVLETKLVKIENS